MEVIYGLHKMNYRLRRVTTVESATVLDSTVATRRKCIPTSSFSGLGHTGNHCAIPAGLITGADVARLAYQHLRDLLYRQFQIRG